MWDYDYDGAREDARSDARAEGGGGRRYRYSCGDATCGASDCGDCRNGDDEEEVEEDEVEEDEVEEDEVRGDDDDDDDDVFWAKLADQSQLDFWKREAEGFEARLRDVLAALDEAGVDTCGDKLEEGDAVRALTAERDQARRERNKARGVSR